MDYYRRKKRKKKFDYSETDETVFLESSKKAPRRLLKRDGTFNIERIGLSASNMYERTQSSSWTRILFSFLIFYFLINAIFAFGFLLCGPENINGVQLGSFWDNYFQMLYFSIQTFTTVGYGHMNPSTHATSLLSSLVAFIGLISFAILTGLSFSKFSKPKAHIIFSKNLLLAPNPLRNDEPSLQFRIVNTSKNQLIDLVARVTLTWLETIDGDLKRRFERLDLELEYIHLFPLNWTIIHQINKSSPLYGLTKEQMIACHMELLILIRGFDDTYTEQVHAKRSYSFNDLKYGAKFITMYQTTDTNTILNLEKIDESEPFEFDEK
ncbi:MAG: ion channel [Bacteroidota bacterium]